MAENTRVWCRRAPGSRLEGGHSNLTYELTDADGDSFVIRRPPEGELLPKAHDMWREFRIIDALHPVGRARWPSRSATATTATVCDTHFYVMGKVGRREALYTAPADRAATRRERSLTRRRLVRRRARPPPLDRPGRGRSG